MKHYFENGVQFIKMEGSILQADTDMLNGFIQDVLSSQNYTVLIDLSDANHICSSALGQLVYFKNKLSEHGGQMKVVLTDDDLLELFELTLLNEIFEIYSDVGSALADLRT
jgi:anti-sigma B factor antagonist